MTNADNKDLIGAVIGIVVVWVLGFGVHALFFGGHPSVTVIEGYTGIDQVYHAVPRIDTTGDTVGYLSFVAGDTAYRKRDTTVVRAVMLRVGGDTVLLGMGQSYGDDE